MEKSIREKIADGDYVNPAPYPKPLIRPRMLPGKHTVEQAQDYVEKLREYQILKPTFYDRVKEWDAKQRELRDIFKKDCLEEAGLLGHPKADLLFNIAWDRGHDEGFNSVYECFIDTAELIT